MLYVILYYEFYESRAHVFAPSSQEHQRSLCFALGVSRREAGAATQVTDDVRSLKYL